MADGNLAATMEWVGSGSQGVAKIGMLRVTVMPLGGIMAPQEHYKKLYSRSGRVVGALVSSAQRDPQALGTSASTNSRIHA
jgi:hypothetical protein